MMIPFRREVIEVPLRAGAALEKGLVLAMSANIAFSEYGRPTAIHRRAREWIVVSRWGEEGEYLTISTAGECTDNAPSAPGGLRPRQTLLGLLVCDASHEPSSTFLLVR